MKDISAYAALGEAQRMSCLPFKFQIADCLLKYEVLSFLDESSDGRATLSDISNACKLSDYATRLLLDCGVAFDFLKKENDLYSITRTSYFLLNDEMARVNFRFAHDVCYLGLSDLKKSLDERRPVGLEYLGPWKSIYPHLKDLKEPAKKSWFDFDHFYSDRAFDDALSVLEKLSPKRIADVGGNTGKFSVRACGKLKDVTVTIIDLPEQCELASASLVEQNLSTRVSLVPCDLLKADHLPEVNADIWWMSQFLDCFSFDEIRHIIRLIKEKMRPEDRIAVLEPFVGSQPHPIGDECLAAFSLYFTAIANGISRFYKKEDFIDLFTEEGLTVEAEHNGLGLGHTLLICRKGA